jgi:Tfp pilus assembly protein PilZ
MSDETKGPERRHERIEASIPVKISTIEPERDPWTGRRYFRASQETCANLSRGGAFVRTVELLHPGQRVLLELELPTGGQLEAIGRVAWTKRALTKDAPGFGTGVGVEFLGAEQEELDALAEYLEREPSAYEDRGN